MTAPNVVYVVPDVMGGMMNIVASLLAHRAPGGLAHHAIRTRNTLVADARFDGRLDADTDSPFEYTLPVENLHAVLDRLWRRVPAGEGVLVANDLLELAMLHTRDPRRMVVQILHGDHDYYYGLSVKHEAVIDVFVTYSRTMFETLRMRLPERAADVCYVPYGVPLPARVRTASNGPLRLVFAGRLEHGQKGVFDLPAIDAALGRRRVACEWTIIGAGPDERRLRERWPGDHVRWRGALPHAAVLSSLHEFDVFVLPTRAEGLPVALVEAMAAGLVPVVSDIDSGVPEVVDDRCGLRPPVGDVGAFAAAIALLGRDRGQLEAMSCAARAAVEGRFDPHQRAAAYEALYARWRDLRRPRPARVPLPYGSRLDRPWIPNPVVRAVRTAIRRGAGHPA